MDTIGGTKLIMQPEPGGWITVPFWLVSLLVGLAVTAGIVYFIRTGAPD